LKRSILNKPHFSKEVYTMGHKVAGWTGVALAALLCYTGVVQAQWVFLGRKALGVVNRLVSTGQGKEGQGYDMATVLLEADADKVYGTAIDLLKGNPHYTITHRDDPSRTVEFTDGKILVGVKVSRLEDKISQLLIGSTVTPGKSSATPLVVDRVFQVCEKLGVHCTFAKD
jgi:hypothetical protein